MRSLAESVVLRKTLTLTAIPFALRWRLVLLTFFFGAALPSAQAAASDPTIATHPVNQSVASGAADTISTMVFVASSEASLPPA